MQRKNRSVKVLKVLLVLAALLVAQSAGAAMDQYCATPPFMSNSVPPNVLIVLDNSGSMNYQAYGGTYNPGQFESGHYYGYFDPESNYLYNGTRWMVTTEDFSAATTANPLASGNFLNWATTRRIDAAKKLLIGGKAAPRSPDGSVTVKLTGEDSASPTRDFAKDYDNSSAPGIIAPFSGNYRYSMKGNKLYVSPINFGSNALLSHSFK